MVSALSKFVLLSGLTLISSTDASFWIGQSRVKRLRADHDETQNSLASKFSALNARLDAIDVDLTTLQQTAANNGQKLHYLAPYNTNYEYFLVASLITDNGIDWYSFQLKASSASTHTAQNAVIIRTPATALDENNNVYRFAPETALKQISCLLKPAFEEYTNTINNNFSPEEFMTRFTYAIQPFAAGNYNAVHTPAPMLTIVNPMTTYCQTLY